MTAIAGLVGAPATGICESGCFASLDALTLYGSRVSVRASAAAAFGVRLHPLLPEDRFDDQPFRNDRFLLVADVRLDNRDELLAALGSGGPRSKRRCDAEILFNAWCRWQERCLDFIVGDYAFAVHDAATGRLFLVRDPMGQRPLFHARIGTTLAFASMPSGILAHLPVEHDRIRVAERLAARENHSRRSYFAGISRVLSGEMVILSLDGEVASRRWNPSLDEITGRTGDDFASELRETFDRAVAARLRRTTSPVATQLSSGYDSSAVTAAAARLIGSKDVIAFTSAPAPGLGTVEIRGRIPDESRVAAETAGFLGIGHEVVRMTQPLLDSLRGHARYYQEPVRNVLNMDWWAEIESRAARRRATVLLIGDAGNLTFSVGGLTALAEWARRGDWRRWWVEAMAASRRPDVRWRGILMTTFRLGLPRRLQEELIRLFLGQPRWDSACFVRPEVLAQLPREARPGPSSPADERVQILQGLDPGVFRKGSLARHGIDERDPTADRRLMEFALRLPPDQLLVRGIYKPLARAALAGRVPQLVIDAPLRGYQGADWVSRFRPEDAFSIVEEISGNSTVDEVIDIPRLKAAVGGWPAAAGSNSGSIESYGRHVTNALAMGVFIVESQSMPMGA
jgi:asparagine synthase (glutamine-hydrolysing)